MAERIKDPEDLQLEALFRSDPIEDDGFSTRVVSKMRHRMWVRRLTLPIAMSLGALISAKPLIQFASALPGLVTSVFGSSLSVDSLPLGDLPQMSTMIFGIALAMVMVLASRLLEE